MFDPELGFVQGIIWEDSGESNRQQSKQLLENIRIEVKVWKVCKCEKKILSSLYNGCGHSLEVLRGVDLELLSVLKILKWHLVSQWVKENNRTAAAVKTGWNAVTQWDKHCIALSAKNSKTIGGARVCFATWNLKNLQTKQNIGKHFWKCNASKQQINKRGFFISRNQILGPGCWSEVQLCNNDYCELIIVMQWLLWVGFTLCLAACAKKTFHPTTPSYIWVPDKR